MKGEFPAYLFPRHKDLFSLHKTFSILFLEKNESSQYKIGDGVLYKKSLFFFFLLFCIIVTGCQQNEKTSTKKEPTKKVKEVKEKEKLPETPISMIGEEIEKEPAGELFQKYSRAKELATNEEYSPTVDEAIKEYIQTMKKVETKEWDAQKWAQSLITNFRSQYSDTIQPMKDFEVKYDKLTLPDGRLLQDVDEEELSKSPDKVNVAILLDASGSMNANVPGGNKMKLAKTSLKSFSESLPKNTNVSLSVFGHKGTGADKDKKLSCSSVETVYPLKNYSKEKFSKALNQFKASGWTPLASAIQKATKQLLQASDEHTKNFIYVVSDGIETCGGNPVNAAKDAKKAKMDVQINIIGFDVDNKADRQLKEVAKAGGGEYTSVKNKQQLDDEITKSWKESMGKTTWRFWVAGNHNNINWDSVGMSNQLRKLFNNHITSRNRELERMNEALNQLLEDKIIDLDTKSATSDFLFKRHEAIKNYADTIQNEKHTEIFDTAERLKKIIDRITKDLDL